jgi:hypothetical protein
MRLFPWCCAIDARMAGLLAASEVGVYSRLPGMWTSKLKAGGGALHAMPGPGG